MQHVAENLAHGKLCTVNVSLATLGLTASFTMKDGAQIFAALATGIWFVTQTVLALWAKHKRRK